MAFLVDSLRRVSQQSIQPGARLDGPSVWVEGQVTGGDWPEVTINGQAVGVELSGRFRRQLPVEPGLNLIVTEAFEEVGGRLSYIDDRRTVLVDAHADPLLPIDPGAVVHLSSAGLERISLLLTEFVNKMELESLILERIPPDVEVSEIDYGHISLEIVPREGHLQVRLSVRALSVEFSGTYLAARFDGSGTADEIHIVADVEARASDDGGLALEIVGSAVDLSDFDYDIRYVPEFIESWFLGMVQSAVEGAIEDALADFVLPSLFDPAALERTVEVLGKPLLLAIRIRSVEVRATGVEMGLQVAAQAPQVVHAGQAIALVGGRPQLDAERDVDLAVAGDTLSRIFHAAWAGGLFDVVVSGDTFPDLPVALSVSLLGAGLGPAASHVDLQAPLTIRARPLLPAVAHIVPEERPLVVEAGALQLEFSDPQGPIVTVAVHMVARMLIVMESLEEIRPELEVSAQVDVASTHRGPVSDETLELLLESIIAFVPIAIADQTFAFGPEALPISLTVDRVEVVADSLAQWLHILADVGQ